MPLPKKKPMIKETRTRIIARLQKAIPGLKDTIDNHTEALQSNEALTRSALVNPMLRALGWEVENPAEVVPEYPVSRKRARKQVADYVLFVKHQELGDYEPSVVIEVKALRALNMKQADGQALQNARDIKAEYYAITDGERWELHKFIVRNTEQITEFNLGAMPTQHLIGALPRMALPLSKQYLGFTNLPPTAAQPIPPSSIPGTIKQKLITTRHTLSDSSNNQWTPITKAYQTLSVPSTGSRSKFIIQLPDQTEITVIGWTKLSQAVINWLDQEQLLNNLTTVPIQKGKGQIFANTEPKSKTGKAFGSPYQTRINGLHFEMKLNSRPLMQGIITLLEMVGQNPDDILVKLQTR